MVRRENTDDLGTFFFLYLSFFFLRFIRFNEGVY
jgi:hypothetical protein